MKYTVGQAVTYTINAGFNGGLGVSATLHGEVKTLYPATKKVKVFLSGSRGKTLEITVREDDPDLRPRAGA